MIHTFAVHAAVFDFFMTPVTDSEKNFSEFWLVN